MIRHLACLVLVAVCSRSAFSQTLHGAAAPNSSWPAAITHGQTVVPHPPAAATQSETELSYYDSTLRSFDWVAGAAYGQLVSLGLGQRMTLPWTNGYLDSISFVVDSVAQDSIHIVISPDTLFDIGGGDLFHLINVFQDAPNPYADIMIPKSQATLGGLTTVSIGHVPVPQNFFVVIVTTLDPSSGLPTPVYIRGDREATRVRTTDNSRSGIVGIYGSNVVTLVLDSTFIATDDASALYSNLYMDAFVSQGDNAVNNVRSATGTLSAYPNPAQDVLNVRAAVEDGSAAELDMYDQLGRSVLHKDQIAASERLDARALPSGTYRLVLRSGGQIISQPVSIVH